MAGSPQVCTMRARRSTSARASQYRRAAGRHRSCGQRLVRCAQPISAACRRARVAARLPEWSLPRTEMAAAFGPKTKAIVLNSPMNPTGKVFSAEELVFIAGLLHRSDAYAICDEVYEHLTFDGVPHIPLMSLRGMRDR